MSRNSPDRGAPSSRPDRPQRPESPLESLGEAVIAPVLGADEENPPEVPGQDAPAVPPGTNPDPNRTARPAA
jgi:hypothetical protein